MVSAHKGRVFLYNEDLGFSLQHPEKYTLFTPSSLRCMWLRQLV